MVLLALAAVPVRRSRRWIPFPTRLGIKSEMLDGRHHAAFATSVKANAQMSTDRNSGRVFSEELVERELPSVSG